MDKERKTRKPGRSAFFEDQGSDDREDSMRERGKISVAPRPEVESQLGTLLEALNAVKRGDFSVRLPRVKDGILAEIAETFNDVVTLNEEMVNELVRVSQVVGDEGELTERVLLKGVTGSWAIQSDSINSLIDNLAQTTAEVVRVITAFAKGDLAEKMRLEIEGQPLTGEFLRIATIVNTMVDQLGSFASEVTRVAMEVGTKGQLGAQAEVAGVAGTWKELTENVNLLAANLTTQVRNIALVNTAVANGDLTQKITVDAQGEILDLKNIVNGMVDQLSIFASEVSKVATEVGDEGRLGAQAEIPGVAGTWKELTANVNMLAGNLTSQVRNIAQVTTAVAMGDLTQKITVDAKGEILDLKNTINAMVDNLSLFGSEVTRVAKEVGVEGRLGAQAEVPGVAGTWQELTENVNMMASSLTVQVRNIAQVTTAVANGDLSQKITIDAKGEIMDLKDTINAMVDNLSVIVGDINNVMVLVGEGNLTRMITAEGSGEFASMIDGINATLGSLLGIVTDLADAGINIGAVSQNMLSAGQEMNAMVTQMTTSVEQIAEGANAQAQQIAEASKESEGVGLVATDTLSRTEDLTRVAEIASNAATEGSKALGETIKNTDLMIEGSQESVTRIESLSKSSQQIQEIVDVIRDIATQTNILAINAAIEAVRAGKQGKGFAVVAEEVKTLSADSKIQAKTISGLVQAILSETGDSVTTIKTLSENVQLVRDSIDQMSKAFGDISGSVESTSGTAEEISIAAADQKKSIDAVSQSLDNISGIAVDTSTAGTQSAESAKQLLSQMQELTSTASTLADMSQRLQQTVGRFEVEERETAKPKSAAAKRKPKSAARTKKGKAK